MPDLIIPVAARPKPPPRLENCVTCRYCVLAKEDEPSKGGVCHERPPVPCVIGMEQTAMGPRPISLSLYSSVGDGDWCGAWELRESAKQ